MTFTDFSLQQFDLIGPEPLPKARQHGYVIHDDAEIWYGIYGKGKPVVLLHGGLGNSNNWGFQVKALVEHNWQVILIDSRGHGRSRWPIGEFHYQQMAEDVIAVLNRMTFEPVSIVGWSDGACTALEIARYYPDRVKDILFFACNVLPEGAKPFVMSKTIEQCLNRHKKDYAMLSPLPKQFARMATALKSMQDREPNYQTAQIHEIKCPVRVAVSESDEFIKFDHAKWLAETLPNGSFWALSQVSHFAPVQDPEQFNRLLFDFLEPSQHQNSMTAEHSSALKDGV